MSRTTTASRTGRLRYRYRRSPHLVAYWRGDQLILEHYAGRVQLEASPLVLDVLNRFSTWEPVERIARHFPQVPRDLLQQLIDALVEHGALETKSRATTATPWDAWTDWSPAASFFHQSTKDVAFTRRDETNRRLKARAIHDPIPPALKPPYRSTKIVLPPPNNSSDDGGRGVVPAPHPANPTAAPFDGGPEGISASSSASAPLYGPGVAPGSSPASSARAPSDGSSSARSAAAPLNDRGVAPASSAATSAATAFDGGRGAAPASLARSAAAPADGGGGAPASSAATSAATAFDGGRGAAPASLARSAAAPADGRGGASASSAARSAAAALRTSQRPEDRARAGAVSARVLQAAPPPARALEDAPLRTLEQMPLGDLQQSDAPARDVFQERNSGALGILGFPDVLLSRRTWRRFGRRRLLLAELSTLLGLTWGVQGWMDIEGWGRMALKTSPSGGARHSIEAYVVVRNVDEVPPGVYHYQPGSHELHLIRKLTDRTARAAIAAYLPQQGFYAEASALMLMSAVFARVQWRYGFPRAYRTVLAEAGHHAQTFCLAATWLGLAPFCTMALADTRIERDLQIDGVSESVLYATGVGPRPAGVTWAPWANTAATPVRTTNLLGRRRGRRQ